MIKDFDHLLATARDFIPGKVEQLTLLSCALLSGSHVLIEDRPGMGKTTMVQFLSKAFGFNLSRIQFTNDLLPGDILGVSVWNPQDHEFQFKKGPIFGEMILADELNRAPAKTQSALLQAMEEKMVSIDNHLFHLHENFTVLATQNPITQLGTFPLPESQLDRFAMKLKMGSPEKEAEIQVLKAADIKEQITHLGPLMSKSDFSHHQESVKSLKVNDEIYRYVQELLENSRRKIPENSLSTRAGIDLIKIAKAYTYINDQSYIKPDTIFYLFPYIAEHRLGPHKQKIVDDILKETPIIR